MWQTDDYGKSRLYEDNLVVFTINNYTATQKQTENLAVVAAERDGRYFYFWRVFEALAWQLPGEPALTLNGITLEGYADTQEQARAQCERVIAEIKKRAGVGGKREEARQAARRNLIIAGRFVANYLIIMLVIFLIVILTAYLGAIP